MGAENIVLCIETTITIDIDHTATMAARIAPDPCVSGQLIGRIGDEAELRMGQFDRRHCTWHAISGGFLLQCQYDASGQRFKLGG